MEVFRGVVPGLASIAAWLSLPTIYGIAYVRLSDTGDLGLWADDLALRCLYWGLAGIVFVPVVAFWLGFKGYRSSVTGASAAVVSLLVYIPASVAALMLIIAVDPSLGGSNGWD
ncbi:MAG: hypothetical protein QM648_06200 [Solirubrobacterales bacterium]